MKGFCLRLLQMLLENHEERRVVNISFNLNFLFNLSEKENRCCQCLLRKKDFVFKNRKRLMKIKVLIFRCYSHVLDIIEYRYCTFIAAWIIGKKGIHIRP